MKVFYYSLIDFFLKRKVLVASLFLLFLLPRLFYGRYVFYYGDGQHYVSSLKSFASYLDTLISLGGNFSLNNKKVIYIMSLLTSGLLGIGLFRKGYLFSKSKLAASYTAFLYFIHPLSVWYSGEPRLVHFSHSLFIAGIFLSLNNNKKLLWKNLLGVCLFFIAVKVSPVMYGYAILYFIFNIAENAFLSKGDNKSNNYIAIGQAGLFWAIAFILLGWNNIIPLSTKVLSELHFISLQFDGGGGNFLGRFPDLMDEYFRSLMKSYFSPILIVVPIMVLLFGRELRISNYSRGLYSISLLITSIFFLEVKELATGNYSQIYFATILSILVGAIGCQRIYKKFSFTSVRVFIILLLPVSLLIGLGARGYRDFYRQQSNVGLIPKFEKHIPINAVIFLPFGQDLNTKQFSRFKYYQNLKVKKTLYLTKKNFHQILNEESKAFYYVDDYYLQNFYWPGKFLLEIKDRLVMEKIVIEKLFETEGPKNKGYLFKLSWPEK